MQEKSYYWSKYCLKRYIFRPVLKAGRKGLLTEQPNHLDKSKHILSDLHSTLTQTGPNTEITDEGFNEALRKSQKDTAPSPDKVQYSDLENLTEERRVVHYLP